MTGKTSGGQAPSGGGEILAAQAMGLQLRMQEAQIKNLEADTNLKNADAKGRRNAKDAELGLGVPRRPVASYL